MDDQQLLRYSRHILLDEIGVEGQARILASSALVVGLGVWVHPQRCIWPVRCWPSDAGGPRHRGPHQLAAPDHPHRGPCGQPKVVSARNALLALHPGSAIDILVEKVDAARLDHLVPGQSVVLDCSDNFATRQALNAACVRHGVPLVSGAAIRFDGQLAVYDPRRATPLLRLRVPLIPLSKKHGAPPWACSHRWSASSAACRRPRR